MIPFARRTALAAVFASTLALPAAAAPSAADSLGAARAVEALPVVWVQAKLVDVTPDAEALAHMAAAREAAARRLAEHTRREALGVRYYPIEAEPLVAAQAVVARRHFSTVHRRARTTFPMIERALQRARLPDDLKYVAVIESALNPLAVSHAGAEGMWQFMPATQSDYGLDSLSVRDPVRSTAAAVQYLGRLGRMFDGDWQLALAAYNCGPARVQRIVRDYERATGETATFWGIRDRLPRETQDYVPRWIAVADWMSG